ncbi:phenylalanine--tRNA ligase subunit alpha [candidate division WWE3 bacterium]|uniref:phenylalanine--tRNA ligase n=1 Tax=candidate division WWE3 bacterium TaxID=2053526 RepID=A0A955LK58_UNCKA|nr:phenylalanine--tRNA ligase subunit alpha [candidate division WWE3 bacterium]
MEKIDTSIPSLPAAIGHWHPISKTYAEITEVFSQMGFEIVEARLVNDEEQVFTTLNFPDNHPARDLMDTFYLESGDIPIPHTSSMQNWILRNRKQELEDNRAIATVIAGRCFRNEKLDPTHAHTFYQLEGMYVDKGVRVSDLIGTLKTAAQVISDRYDLGLELKVLTTFFPFVEPGIEVLARKPGSDKWLELIPAGMIHPHVLDMGGVDSEVYNGFAWAIGIDRLAILIYDIDDIRHIHSGDLRFVRQF